MKRFENKVAFITGGNSGIGKVSAILIAREGAKVVIADLIENSEVIDMIRNEGGEVKFVKCDVSVHEDMERAVAETVSTFGSLDIALNNAGIADSNRAPIHEKSIEEWQQVQDVNLNGMFYGMKHQINQMRKQDSGGSIINVGSVMSYVANEGVASYVSSKHAVIGLTKTAALENAPHNIRVNAICPAYINTPMLSIDSEQARAYMESLHPMKRLGEPEEIARVFLFFASEDSSFCTGTYLPVDGGYLLK